MTPERANYIRKLYFNKYNAFKQTELAKMFGISQGNISRIISGQSW